ncbi:hypothetical protein PENTCL1PPCAC_30051, partial [Pristionchus entomophagus]
FSRNKLILFTSQSNHSIVSIMAVVSVVSVVSMVVVPMVVLVSALLGSVVMALMMMVVLVVIPKLLVRASPSLASRLHSTSALLQTDVLDDVITGLLDEHLLGESVGNSVLVLVDLELLAIDLFPRPGSLLERGGSIVGSCEFLGNSIEILDGVGEGGEAEEAQEEERTHPKLKRI